MSVVRFEVCLMEFLASDDEVDEQLRLHFRSCGVGVR